MHISPSLQIEIDVSTVFQQLRVYIKTSKSPFYLIIVNCICTLLSSRTRPKNILRKKT